MNKNCKSCGAPRGYYDKRCSYCGSALKSNKRSAVIRQTADNNSVQIGGVNITGSVSVEGDVSGLNIVRIEKKGVSNE